MKHLCDPNFLFNHRTASRRKAEPGMFPVSDDAQKKFAGAKAISSDMYFGKQDDAEVMPNYTSLYGFIPQWPN